MIVFKMSFERRLLMTFGTLAVESGSRLKFEGLFTLRFELKLAEGA